MNKKYEVRLGKRAQKNLKKIDINDAKIIMAWISKNLVDCQDPYIHGKSLKGSLKGKWRYRIGDYRLICNIDDEKLTILILEAGHRRVIPKNCV
ncbi:MAG TPA: type II toxin-antitoxin system RelE/ParE family toxin [Tissierellaceae bacterium]|nr:type II toxin-antitoxin system RelE/ParE family toxin [Tissierellaceae bacterium]